MKKIVIDLNILLDFLDKRDFHQQAAAILQLIENKKAQGFVCAHAISTLSYFLEKSPLHRAFSKQVITTFLDIFEVLEINESVLRDALRSPLTDFEDAIIEAASAKNSVDYIITRNLKDFQKSQILALSPSQFLNL